MSRHVPPIPEAVAWRNGLVLSPLHFQQADLRNATLSYVAALVADPWPWGFTSFLLDETALASGQLRIDCVGFFPGGQSFSESGLTLNLDVRDRQDGDQASFCLSRNGQSGELFLKLGEDMPSEVTLPVARLVYRGGVWGTSPEWAPPALLIDADHPMRAELNRQLGALSALSAGFMATLRLPGAEERPLARVLGQVAAALAQGVGVIQALLAAPSVAPGRLGIEALRLALGVRSAAGVFERLDVVWDPADQRGSMHRLLYAAETAASGIGLPFRASVFRAGADPGTFVVEDVPPGDLLLAIEASRPAELLSARSWLEGAALATPDRIQEALTRRVAGCSRRPMERDPRIGISSGPLLALYHVDDDAFWRGGAPALALAARTPPPANVSFSMLLPEDDSDLGLPAALPAPAATPGRMSHAPWRSGG